MELKFFDWTTPSFLSDVAEELLQRYGREGCLDMRSVVIILPSKSAVHSLEVLLVTKVEKLIAAAKLQSDWYPPNILTIGTFPELFYKQQKPLASEMTQNATWDFVLREMEKNEPTLLEELLPSGIGDLFSQRLVFAQMLARLHRDLASDGLKFEDVLAACRSAEMTTEIPRWAALHKLQKRYWEILDSVPLWDIQTARYIALQKKEYQTDQNVFVVGVADLNKVQKSILTALGNQVHLFVAAPESQQKRFDTTGSLLPDQWQIEQFDTATEGQDSLQPLWNTLDESQIEQWQGPEEEAKSILYWTAAQADLYAKELSTTDTTSIEPDVSFFKRLAVCVPNNLCTEIIPHLERLFSPFGISVVDSAGFSMTENRVFHLLLQILTFVKDRKYSTLTELVRHPDIEQYIRHHWYQGKKPRLPQGDWLTQFDHWQNRFLPNRVEEKWRIPETSPDDPAPIDFSLFQHVNSILAELLLPFFGAEKPKEQPMLFELDEIAESSGAEHISSVLQRLENGGWRVVEKELSPAQWCDVLSVFLVNIYAKEENVSKTSPENSLFQQQADHQIKQGIQAVHNVLNELADVPEPLLPTLSAYQVLYLLTDQLKNLRTPSLVVEPALRLTGWIDLRLNDATEILIAGMNEGMIPTSHSNDSFLPEALRRLLGLEDSQHRFARDVYAFSVILASRPNIRLLFARRNFAQDPLLPSRFLFIPHPESMADKICRWFQEPETNSRIESSDETLIEEKDFCPNNEIVTSKLHPPLLRMEGTPPHSLRVTEFADFLTCPYRYFLRHRLKLVALDDHHQELDPLTGGNISHEVLSRFGRHAEITDSCDPNEIFHWLSKELDKVCYGLFQRNTFPVVSIQIEQIRNRLYHFSQWQAAWRAAGNVIRFTEIAPDDPVSFFVDNQTMQLHGRIDRIDYHPETNQWYLFDYKTFTKAEYGKKDSPLPASLSIEIFPQNGEGKLLITAASGNSVDKKHRDSSGHWINLQLVLYRKIFQQILLEEGIATNGRPPLAGYIILLPNKETATQLAPWDEDMFQSGEETAHWVMQTIQQLWNQDISPKGMIDYFGEQKPILNSKAASLFREFSSITREDCF